MVVDLQLVAIQHPVALNIFAVAARQAAIWSGTELVLISGPALEGRLKSRVRVLGNFVRICPNLSVALAAVHQPPLRRLSVELLPSGRVAASSARRHVAERLNQWDCGVLTEDAVAVAAELVHHVIQIFAIEPVLRLELRQSLLTVAIAHRQIAGTTDEASIDPLSRRILTGIAQTWGTSATQTGTVVWCVLRVPA
ncbi:hypothetical protein [Kribbella sp. NPDC023855]|uniref:hypothetical protein n=1 Tax=Kribbella sp. NPDC023855 TaxID=3154698 RepID=UPI0033DC2B35